MKILIRVLCVFGNLNRGGAESMCMNLYRKIDRTKIQFDFVKHTSEKCAFDDEIESLGGKIFIAPRFKIYYIFKYRKWWKIHLANHPEHKIIHGHVFTISSLFFSVAKKLNCITIGHSHSTLSLNSEQNLKSMIRAFFRRNVEKLSDYCLACSKSAGEFLFPNKDFTVLNNAIDTDKFIFNEDMRIQMRNTFEYEISDVVMCVVASFTEPKNPLGVLNIFEYIYSKNKNAKLLWVGDGPLRASFDAKVSELGLSGCVKTVGVRNDTFNVLQAADVFMLASFFEGLPVSAVEAQASGLPCLLSNGISSETNITGLCHFLPIDNPERWYEALSNLEFCNRKNTKSEIVAAGYNVATTANWLQNFYTNIFEERNLRNE